MSRIIAAPRQADLALAARRFRAAPARPRDRLLLPAGPPIQMSTLSTPAPAARPLMR